MRRDTLGDRCPVPPGVTPRAIVTVEGVLAKQPGIHDLPGERGTFCEGVIQAGKMDLPVITRAGKGEQLGRITGRSGVRVSGRLVVQKWNTGGGAKATEASRRQRLAVEIDCIDAVWPPADRDLIGEDVP